MFLAIFTILLLFANIYFFTQKKYPYLFIPCMLFLPDYYGIEVSDSLPIFSATRIMFIVLYFYSFINRDHNVTLKSIKLKNITKELYFLAFYFILRSISNLYYITTYTQAAKTILSIVFEQLFLLIAFYYLNPSKEEIINIIKSIVWSATVLFIIGILESITYFRLFDELYTISRETLNIYYIRLGFLRATTTMGMPGFYGNMCILVTPLIIYLYHLTHKQIYIGVCFLNILAIIHSGCRSDIIFYIAIILYYFILNIRNKESRLRIMKNATVIVVSLMAWVFILSIISPRLNYYYLGTAKSTLNSIGFHFDLDEGAPDGVIGYGDNKDGNYSRTMQFSGMQYVAKTKPIFGYGSGAQVRGGIHYSYYGKDYILHSYDTGIVEVFCDEGIIGIIGVLSLMIFAMISSHNKTYYRLATISYILSTFSTSNMYRFLFVFIVLFGLYYSFNDAKNITK